MKALWARHAAKFDGLSPRERLLVAGALVGGVALLGHLLVIGPQLTQRAALTKQIGQHRNDLAAVRAQTRLLQANQPDPDAATRARLEQLRAEVNAIDARVRALHRVVVPPQRMAALLEEMLRRNRKLSLISLRALPPTPLVKSAGDAAGPATSAEAGKGEVYRHGIELTVAGTYADLTAYLQDLERMPQKVFWSTVKLEAEEHPRATLVVTVHTLSFDKAWLVV